MHYYLQWQQMKSRVPKKTQKAQQSQPKLTTYYHSKKQETMNKDQEEGWNISQRVELRHAHQLQKPKQEPPHPQPTHNHSNHSATDQLSSISANSHTPEHRQESKELSKKVNLQFYLNRMASQPYGEYIDKIHETWYHNYEKLERDHSFIQWIFPNSFQSRFNSYAKPLSKEEAEEFRSNPQIIKRYLKSYDMMLAFYGMKLKDKQTGEVVRSRQPNYKERFYKTLITSWHNHMRVTRILCSLKQTGFGRYAAQLAKFLKFQIYSQNGELGALKKYSVYKEWEPFEHFQQKGQQINYYLQRFTKKIEDYRHQHSEGSTITGPKIECVRGDDRPKNLEKSPGHRGLCKENKQLEKRIEGID